MSAIKLENINKVYPNGHTALKDISFEVEKGEFLVMVGPSGCGKSSLLRMIAGLEDISSGNLFFDSEKINDKEPKDRNIGMVFQNYALYPHLTIAENLAFPLTIKKEKKEIIKRKVEEVAKMLDLELYLNRKPKELSGGQRQRVALGRALIKHPAVFLFDEPLSNLDAKLRMSMRGEITRLHREVGATSIYVTHDQVEAMTMADKIAILKLGILQQFGTPEQIYNSPANLFVAEFIGSPQINIFSGTLHNGIFNEDKAKVSFQVKSVHEGKVLLGIRPEHLYLEELAGAEKIEVDVTNAEYLGNETLVYFQVSGRDCCIRTGKKIHGTKFQNNDKLTVYLDSSKLLFFDSSTETLIQ